MNWHQQIQLLRILLPINVCLHNLQILIATSQFNYETFCELPAVPHPP
ncbi:unnamed protein product [Meloidogyne enterolobii]|uniref:Uncharacterized protein n=2 Tax=Meloidogyne enterolobii TaxID=390850 RepID=A0ACB0YVS6_MELEN